MSCALCILRAVNRHEFLDDVVAKGELVKQTLADMAVDSPVPISNIRGAGLLWAFTLAKPIAEAVRDCALELGLLVNAPRPDVLRFMPSLRVTAEEIESMLKTLGVALAAAGAAPDD